MAKILDELAVLRATVALQTAQITNLRTSLDAVRMKKLRDKVSELKGTIVALSGAYKEQRTAANRAQKRETLFRDVFRLRAPFPGETQCRVSVDEPKLFKYFKEYGNPKMEDQKETTP